MKGRLYELRKYYSESVAFDLGVLEGSRISEVTDGQREKKKKDESGFA